MTGYKKGKISVLVLLWHPYGLGAVAGGFRIIQEVLRRTPTRFEVEAVDSEPSILRGINTIRIYEYAVPKIVERIKKKCFPVGKIIEFFASLLLISTYSLRLNATKSYDVIYVPFSELLNVSLPSLITKFIFNTKIVLALLNINVYGGTMISAFSEIRRSGYSILTGVLAILGWPFIGHLLKIVHNGADMVITLSNNLAGTIMEGIDKVKAMSVIPTGIDYKSIINVNVEEKIYDGIFVGRYAQEKGIFDLIKAWSLVVKKKANAKIILVGPGNASVIKKMKEEIERYSLSSNMILHGPEPDYIEVIRLFKMSRINIFLSYIEGWGLVPIEGLACSIPVIAYDLAVYNENIRNCEAAFIVPRGDFSETSKTILWLLSKSDKELNKLGQIATRFASQYDWDSSARKTFNVLEKIAR